MNNLWERIKKGVREGISTAAERGEEFGRLAKVRLDISKIRSDINRTFADLGRLVYRLIEEGRTGIEGDERVRDLIEKVKGLEADLKREEDHLEKIRRERREEAPVEESEPQQSTTHD